MALRGSYLRLADELRHKLDAGDPAPGSMLPSEHSLASEFGVSRGTVRAALAVLQEASLIEVVPGQGRRVVVAADSERAPIAAWEKVLFDLRQLLPKAADFNSVPLPSEADLMARHGVSRNTVRRAYRQLVEEGLVVVRHGAGAFAVKGDGSYD